MQGDSGTLKKVKRKFTTLGIKSRDDEDELPEDSDKETPKRRIKHKLVKLREKLGEELHEESESARERLKARIAKLNEKLIRDDDDDLFDDDETQEQRSLRIKHRIARLGEKLRRAPSEVEDGKDGRRLEGSSEADSQTSEERFDVDGSQEGTMFEKLGQRLKERSDKVQRVRLCRYIMSKRRKDPLLPSWTNHRTLLSPLTNATFRHCLQLTLPPLLTSKLSQAVIIIQQDMNRGVQAGPAHTRLLITES